MKRILTNNAPKAIGTYSQGTVIGKLIFTSGQIPINPESGKLVEGEFVDEVLQVLHNIESILIEAGSTKENIVKLTVYMVDLSQFNEVNKAFEIFFDRDFPSRSTVQVSRLPMDVNIEIEAIGQIS